MDTAHAQAPSEPHNYQHPGVPSQQENSIAVFKGICPISGQMTFALYEGDLPIIPATIYLRHLGINRGLTANSLLTCAYALKPFFTFLKQQSVSFWSLTPETVIKFKESQLRRAVEDTPSLRHQTVRQYLTAVKGLVQYWRTPRHDDPFGFDFTLEVDGARVKRQGHGRMLHVSWYSHMPGSIWDVHIPVAARHTKRRHKGLTREQSSRVMEVLNRRPRRTASEVLLFYRDRAIWAFSLMSCLRKGELVRIRLEDACRSTGVITIRDRPEDRWLGDLKTGPGEVYVTSDNLYWSYLESWLMYGRPIAEDILSEQGSEDHGLLFCNCDGGPLTRAAINHLFEQLRQECGFGRDVPLHHHIARHTMATLLLENGVEPTEIQQYLRHRSIKSTEIYATITTGTLRRALDNFWSTYKL